MSQLAARERFFNYFSRVEWEILIDRGLNIIKIMKIKKIHKKIDFTHFGFAVDDVGETIIAFHFDVINIDVE